MPIEPEDQQPSTTIAEEALEYGKFSRESPSGEVLGSGRVWHLYVLECADRSLYCGIALDVQKRLAQHQKGKGARYTRARLPVNLLSSIEVGPDVADALRAERRFKALPRAKKLKSLESISTLIG